MGSDQDITPQDSRSEEHPLAPFKNQVTSDDGTDDMMDTAGSSMDEGEITDYNPGTPTNEEANQVPVRELGQDQHLRGLESTHEDTISHATEFPGNQGVQDESMVVVSAPDSPHRAPTSSSSVRSLSQDYLKDGTELPFAESGQEEGEIEMDYSDDYEPPEPASPASPVEEKASPSHALSLAIASPSTSAEPLTELALQAASATLPTLAEARQTPTSIIEDPVSPHKVRESSLTWHLPNVL